MVCLKHPDREAAAVCAACGKPLCAECILHADEADFCSDNCHQKGIESRKRSIEVIRSAAESSRKSGRRALIWLIVVIIAGSAGWYFYKQNRKQIHKKVSRSPLRSKPELMKRSTPEKVPCRRIQNTNATVKRW